MAIELDLPTDIRKHEQKTVGPLTTRQFCYTLPAIGLGALAYILTKPIGGNVQLYATLTVTIPFLLLGFGKVYGIPLDKFIYSVGGSVIMGYIDPKSKHRVYKTENVYLAATDKACREEEAKNQKKKIKKKKDSLKSKEFIRYE